MPGRRAPFFCLLLALLAQFCIAAPAPAAPPAKAPAPLVLVVQSYNPEFIWSQEINQGLREALKGVRVELAFRYLDAKRRPDPEQQRQAAWAVLEEIERLRPRLVIAVDDPAQEYLVAPHLKDRPGVQVIFCGVNAPLSRYGFPAANVSGVRERWHFREGFALLKKIVPSLGSVAVLMDSSESSGYVLEDMREDRRRNGPFALEVSRVVQATTFQQWQREALEAQARGDALALGLYHSLLDEQTDQVAPPDTVNAWSQRNLRRPSVGFSDIVKQHGQLCGVLESGREQGHLAGRMARSVLERGVAAGRLPVQLNNRGVVLVNLKTAERLGIVVPYPIIGAAEILIQ